VADESKTAIAISPERFRNIQSRPISRVQQASHVTVGLPNRAVNPSRSVGVQRSAN
jgi:hypothetical protein